MHINNMQVDTLKSGFLVTNSEHCFSHSHHGLQALFRFITETSRMTSRASFSKTSAATSSLWVNQEMVRRFRLWLKAQNYERSTVEKYCCICKGFCAFIRDKEMTEVVPLDISDYITSNLPLKQSDNLVNGRLAALRSFFDFLYMGGAVDAAPPRFIRPRSIPKKLPIVLTKSQAQRLLSRTRKLRDRAFLELLYATGCRLIEILPLRLENIDFRKRTIRVKGKRKERIVYFGPPAAQALRRYAGHRKHGYVFRVEYRRQLGHIHPTTKTWVGHYL
jgi:site-specific recombinase XerD